MPYLTIYITIKVHVCIIEYYSSRHIVNLCFDNKIFIVTVQNEAKV